MRKQIYNLSFMHNIDDNNSTQNVAEIISTTLD